MKSSAPRCACHGWPWYECDDLVPVIGFMLHRGLLVWWGGVHLRVPRDVKGITE